MEKSPTGHSTVLADVAVTGLAVRRFFTITQSLLILICDSINTVNPSKFCSGWLQLRHFWYVKTPHYV